MTQTLEKMTVPKLDIEVNSRADLFEVLAVWYAFLGRATEAYVDPPYNVNYIDYLAWNRESAAMLSGLWDVADRNGWNDIFTSNVISRNTLSESGVEDSLGLGGRGMLVPVIRLGKNMMESDPTLIWDAQNPNVATYVTEIAGWVGGAMCDETGLEILFKRLEYKPTDAERANAATGHWAAVIERRLLWQNAFSESPLLAEEVISNPANRRYGFVHHERTFKTPTEWRLFDRLNGGEPVPELTALICAHLLQKYAAIRYVPENVAEAKQAMQKQIDRARALIVKMPLDAALDIARSYDARVQAK